MRIDRAKFAAAVATADMRLGELSTLAGVSRSTITAIRSGKSCTQETAGKIAAALGVGVCDIAQAQYQAREVVS